MTGHNSSYASVAFKRREGTYRGSALLSDLTMLRNDPAQTMRTVTSIYQGSLGEIRQWQRDVKYLRESRTPLSAKKAWELGDIVHRLRTDLAKHGCRLEDLYDHLERHAGLPRKWLRQFVTLRRYIDNMDTIPDGLRWNSVAKKAKSAGQAIAGSQPVEY